MSVQYDRVEAEVERHMATEPGGGSDEGKKSAATTLVEIAQERYRFGVSTEGETFAVPSSGPRVAVSLRGNKNSLRGQLAREYFHKTSKAAPQQALADALLVIDGIAQETEPEPLHLRVAEHGGAHWLDLGDTTGRAVRIAADGWTVVPEPPVLFKRTALNGALPEPEHGGSLDDLWSRLNVAESDRPLVLAWLVSILYPDMAHPVLALFGEQGTGKTTAQKAIISCLDPGPVPTRKPPRDADSWVTAAAGSWVVGLDNLSTVPDWLSDSICRAVTGDGDVRRKLYTDGEHHVFAFRRVLAINGIDVGALRGDLSERLLPVALEPIPESERLCDSEIWPSWQREHPRILGALLREAARIARLLPFVRLESKPRMADFARIVAAVDEALGTDGLATYLEKQGSLAADSLSVDPFIEAVRSLGEFEGTASDLLDRVTPDRPPKGWPAAARVATQRLRRHSPALRRAGFEVSDDGGRNHRNAAIWSIRQRPEIISNSSSRSSHSSPQTASQEWQGEA